MATHIEKASSTQSLSDINELLIAGDSNRLDEKLVAALSIEGGLCLHRLQENFGGQLA